MIKHIGLLVGLVLPASIVAQESTNAPVAQTIAVSPSPARNSPSELRTVPLVAGPATVVGRNVNVRGRPTIKAEVVAKVTRGDQVTVLEEITLARSAADEPSAWAKIILPPSAKVWVNANFINRDSNSVIPRRLNLRGGPGENFSVLGQLERGDNVTVIRAQEEWMEIEHPTNAYAFVAAQYLEQMPPAAAATTVAETKPVEVATPPVQAEKPAETPVVSEAVAESPTVTVGAAIPEAAPATTVPPATNIVLSADPRTLPPDGETWTPTNEVAQVTSSEEPLPPRIVHREGVVRGTISIQAPTRYELWSPESGKAINYLYTTSSSLDLARYKGLRIVVTGEEALDERWRNTPVITIQKIVVVE